jgi:hypothetical protein
MRLNFSGVSEDEIREGIRRLGEVVREQVALYGTLSGQAPAPALERGAGAKRVTPGAGPAGPAPDQSPSAEPVPMEAGAADNVLHLSRKRAS